jgi:hypothetical protein
MVILNNKYFRDYYVVILIILHVYYCCSRKYLLIKNGFYLRKFTGNNFKIPIPRTVAILVILFFIINVSMFCNVWYCQLIPILTSSGPTSILSGDNVATISRIRVSAILLLPLAEI